MNLEMQKSKIRIESIDVLRGLVMVIMALDHVRDFTHITSQTDDPLNLATTTPLLFFTRWITHLCAPVFVFLSGTSIYLQSLRKTKKELSTFLLKRGAWLILVEWIVVSFCWTFNPHYTYIVFQVIWTIGISMIILGFLIYLPNKFILALGLIIVFGHNLLDYSEHAASYHHTFVMDLLHSAHFSVYPLVQNHSAILVYPFLAWTGVMLLGYCAGVWFSKKYTQENRRSLLIGTGLLLLLLFFGLRFTNAYGDPTQWSEQKNGLYTFFSFVSVTKYPPSLLYLSITLGISFIFLALIETVSNSFTRAMGVFGRVAFFYYIVHLFLAHFVNAVSYLIHGHALSEAGNTGSHFNFYFVIPGEGYNLGIVYLVWIVIVLALYPLCVVYDKYKSTHKEKWWLSYL
jgi:uncharacterized membrane protein